jgi:uncharacterized HhH-GPD family protein
VAAPKALYFTTDDEANRLLASDPFALLVGFALDQQVTVPTAFAGPLKIKQRLGSLAPQDVAAADLEEIFKQKPAVHRFPGSMAQRVRDLAQHVVDEYGGDASKLWKGARDSDDLRARLEALPGFGDMKITSTAAVLAKRFGVAKAEPLVPNHPTLGDVDSPEALASYQEAKRARKASMRSRS